MTARTRPLPPPPLVLLLFLVFPSLCPAAPAELQSTITEVTVFADRAEIKRVAKRAAEAGEQVLAFKGLPDNLDPASVQVSGSGDAILQDIRFERHQLAVMAQDKLQRLDDDIRRLGDSARVLDDNITHAQQEMAFVQSIADGLTRKDSKEQPIELDPSKWAQMVTFYRGKLDALAKQIRSDEAAKRMLSIETDRTQRERRDIAGSEQKVSNDVEVTLSAKKSTTVTLELTYIVFGPGWSPLYDIRVSSDTKKLELTYKANVHQATSEEWKGVKIKLSTASPSQGGSHPELEPWRLSFAQPRYDSYGESKRSRSAAPAMMKQMMSNEMPMKERDEELEEAPMEVATAQVETRSTSVVFVPESRATVTNDNQPSTVVIAVLNFSANFRYSTVPKLSQHAYLKAKAKNETDYPLLPGRTNVFFDNAFVTSSSLELVAPTEEFWTFLGIDEAISVEYKLIRRFEEDIAKKKKITWEYRTVIQNNKKTKEEIVMWDQLPISSDEEITVEAIEPPLKENTSAVKADEQKFVEWYFALEPGKKVTVPFSFAVRHPKDRSVDGL